MWTINDWPPHVFLCSPFHWVYPYSSRQMTIWERLLAMADPLQTQMTHRFICWLHWFSMQALYFMSDAISQHWLLKSTSSRIRCLSSWKKIDCWLLFMCPALTPTLWVKYKIINTFLWPCLASSDPWLCNLNEWLSYWRLHTTEIVNLYFQSVSDSEKGKERSDSHSHDSPLKAEYQGVVGSHVNDVRHCGCVHLRQSDTLKGKRKDKSPMWTWDAEVHCGQVQIVNGTWTALIEQFSSTQSALQCFTMASGSPVRTHIHTPIGAQGD